MAFSPTTFALLHAIHRRPTAAFYLENKAAFQEHVERPLQAVMHAAAEKLPLGLRERLETRRNVFSRFLKNDFGRGGAWSNYWGAFYPKDGRRIASVQLAVWLNRERLHISFYISDYGREVRARFRRNLDRLRPELPGLLAGLTACPGVFLAREGETVLDDTGRVVPAAPMTWDEWLADPAAGGYWAFYPLTPPEVLAIDAGALGEKIARLHGLYGPLAWMAMEEDPAAWLWAYQQ